jgi:hypothetical protein
MPAGQVTITGPSEVAPVSSDPNALATAMELTAVARVTEIAGSAVPATATVTTTPTATATSAPVSAGPCSPAVTATVNANVRSGPDTAYDIVGSLTLGQTATIVGRNDAYTWWYIDYPGVAGNHAWIAGSVVTSACVPAVVQVVAAPPLPATPTEVVAASDDDDDDDNGPLLLQPVPGLLFALKPDLVVTSMVVTPNSTKKGDEISVQIIIKNQGNMDANNFSVQWWSSWATVGKSLSVSSLAAGASKTLNFTYVYNTCSTYDIKVVADGGGLINESDEANNSIQSSIFVACN